jgi:hypothetical protein
VSDPFHVVSRRRRRCRRASERVRSADSGPVDSEPDCVYVTQPMYEVAERKLGPECSISGAAGGEAAKLDLVGMLFAPEEMLSRHRLHWCVG